MTGLVSVEQLQQSELLLGPFFQIRSPYTFCRGSSIEKSGSMISKFDAFFKRAGGKLDPIAQLAPVCRLAAPTRPAFGTRFTDH